MLSSLLKAHITTFYKTRLLKLYLSSYLMTHTICNNFSQELWRKSTIPWVWGYSMMFFRLIVYMNYANVVYI